MLHKHPADSAASFPQPQPSKEEINEGASSSGSECSQQELAPSHDTSERSTRLSFRAFLLFLGPGLLMSVAYLDPGAPQGDAGPPC